MNRLLELFLDIACLPKEMILMNDVLYHPGRIQNSFVTNILGYIIWMHICGGSAHFSIAKVKEGYLRFLDLLISVNLSFVKRPSSFIKLDAIRTSHVLLYNYGKHTERKYTQHDIWNESS